MYVSTNLVHSKRVDYKEVKNIDNKMYSFFTRTGKYRLFCFITDANPRIN